MSAIPAQVLGAVATVALVIAPVATASPAAAATRASHRHTMAMETAEPLGWFIGQYSQMLKLDGRSIRALRAAMGVAKSVNDQAGFDLVQITGLSDRNHDGRDDDAKVVVRALDNIATLTMHKDGTFAMTDSGFVFHNARAMLKESAQSFDRALRSPGMEGEDSWDMVQIKILKAEMPAGVRVVSDYDGNHDGYDDDGRLTFLAGGKAVTLTIGNTAKQVGKVSYGPTWKTKAPKRTHHPLPRPHFAPRPLVPPTGR